MTEQSSPPPAPVSANPACVGSAASRVSMAAGAEPDDELLQVALERAGLPATALGALAESALGVTLPDAVAP